MTCFYSAGFRRIEEYIGFLRQYGALYACERLSPFADIDWERLLARLIIEIAERNVNVTAMFESTLLNIRVLDILLFFGVIEYFLQC